MLEKNWSFFERRLNAEPMSVKSAAPTVFPTRGMRYSRFPRSWVSPPTDVNERGSWTVLLPLTTVKTPMFASDAGTPGTGTGVPLAFEATTTFRDVINVSSGTVGVIERTLYPRTVNSSPRKKRSKMGIPSTNASEFEFLILLEIAKLPVVAAMSLKPKTSGFSDFFRRIGINCV